MNNKDIKMLTGINNVPLLTDGRIDASETLEIPVLPIFSKGYTLSGVILPIWFSRFEHIRLYDSKETLRIIEEEREKWEEDAK